MRLALYLHILGGALGILSGAAAVWAAKGGPLHRKSGLLFVVSMLLMAFTGAGIAALTGVDTSVIAASLTAYLVVTAFTTVLPGSPRITRVNAAAVAVGAGVGLACLALGAYSLSRGEWIRTGMPVPMLFVFGSIALASAAADLRLRRTGPPTGRRRLARHLWRMCFALFIASASFFLGQSDKFPESLRIMPLLFAIAFAPLVVMGYWLWRVRRKAVGVVVRDPHLHGHPNQEQGGSSLKISPTVLTNRHEESL